MEQTRWETGFVQWVQFNWRGGKRNREEWKLNGVTIRVESVCQSAVGLGLRWKVEQRPSLDHSWEALQGGAGGVRRTGGARGEKHWLFPQKQRKWGPWGS